MNFGMGEMKKLRYIATCTVRASLEIEPLNQKSLKYPHTAAQDGLKLVRNNRCKELFLLI